MMRGLPGSGKSTRAKEIFKSGGNFYRLNRDHLRAMMFFSEHNGKREGDVIAAEKLLVGQFLDEGKNVIIDDCNLGQKHAILWRHFIDEYNHNSDNPVPAHLEIERVDTPVEECITRDAFRDRTVGRSVIMTMALQYGYHQPKQVVLCDLDGTLCDIGHRVSYVNELCESCKGNSRDGKACPDAGIHQAKDWKSFFYALPDDSLRMEVFEQLKAAHAAGCEIYYLSARPELYREATEAWLKKWASAVPYKALIMRGKQDSREDSLVKSEMLQKYFPDKSVVQCVFDDRPRVIRMWRDLGLTVIDVGNGVEF